MFSPYFFFDPTMILLIPGILLGLWASYNVNATFNKYNTVIARNGLTGAQVAERVLHHHGETVPVGELRHDLEPPGRVEASADNSARMWPPQIYR